MFIVDIKKLIDYGQTNYTDMTSEPHSGDRSWEHCHQAFLYYKNKYTDPKTMLTSDEMDYLCLQLGWYLASWGMLRNSFLREYNHKIHEDAIKIIYDHKWDDLWDIDYASLTQQQANLIVELSAQVCNTYARLPSNATGDLTDTLKTKILLGTVACVPAYDRYFVNAIKYCNIKTATFNKTSIMELSQVYITYKADFEAMQTFCGTTPTYPSAKLLDMCLFKMGSETSTIEPKAKNCLIKKFPDFNCRQKADKEKLIFLCLYAIHKTSLPAIFGANSDFINIYQLDPTFFDDTSSKL